MVGKAVHGVSEPIDGNRSRDRDRCCMEHFAHGRTNQGHPNDDIARFVDDHSRAAFIIVLRKA